MIAYQLPLDRTFGFKEACGAVGHLQRLGIRQIHIPQAISRELGGKSGFKLLQKRVARHPHMQLTTGEPFGEEQLLQTDTTYRRHALSDQRLKWHLLCKKWSQSHQRFCDYVGEKRVPSMEEERALYERLVCEWPGAPNSESKQFVDCILTPNPRNSFVGEIKEAAEWVAWYGLLNHLASLTLSVFSKKQVVLKHGDAPWDQLALRQFCKLDGEERFDAVKGLLENWQTGLIKLWLLRCLFHLRAQLDEMVTFGQARSVELKGPRHQAVSCRAFRYNKQSLLVFTPRNWGLIERQQALRIPQDYWQDTHLALEDNASVLSRNLLLNNRIYPRFGERTIKMSSVFRLLPVAVTLIEHANN